MAGLAELAAVMMESAQRRVDVTAENVSNLTTPAFRSRRVFSQIVDLRQPVPVDIVSGAGSGQAAIKSTGNPLDIATDANSLLELRSGNSLSQARSAQLHRDVDGRLCDAQGRALQSDGGGDLIVRAGVPTILKDGTVEIEGQAEGKIGLFKPADAAEGNDSAKGEPRRGGKSQMPGSAENGILYQGSIVASDVDLGSEMIELTKASRQAETGARVFTLYDDLLGQAASKLGDFSK